MCEEVGVESDRAERGEGYEGWREGEGGGGG